jgi:hypothetical protein
LKVNRPTGPLRPALAIRHQGSGFRLGTHPGTERGAAGITSGKFTGSDFALNRWCHDSRQVSLLGLFEAFAKTARSAFDLIKTGENVQNTGFFETARFASVIR